MHGERGRSPLGFKTKRQRRRSCPEERSSQESRKREKIIGGGVACAGQVAMSAGVDRSD